MNMNYVAPELEVIEIEIEGVIAESLGGSTSGSQSESTEVEVATRGLFI